LTSLNINRNHLGFVFHLLKRDKTNQLPAFRIHGQPDSGDIGAVNELKQFRI